MKIIKIKAADPMPEGCKQPESVIIEISGNIAELTYKHNEACHPSLKEVKKIFDMEATKLFYALVESLPQGVIEPLVIKLLQHRVSLYHGTMEPRHTTKPVLVEKKAVKNPCSQCGEEWDAVKTSPCPHCGNEVPF